METEDLKIESKSLRASPPAAPKPRPAEAPATRLGAGAQTAGTHRQPPTITSANTHKLRFAGHTPAKIWHNSPATRRPNYKFTGHTPAKMLLGSRATRRPLSGTRCRPLSPSVWAAPSVLMPEQELSPRPVVQQPLVQQQSPRWHPGWWCGT
jgi:hypothetical protein